LRRAIYTFLRQPPSFTSARRAKSRFPIIHSTSTRSRGYNFATVHLTEMYLICTDSTRRGLSVHTKFIIQFSKTQKLFN
jgi:hypothetical protein